MRDRISLVILAIFVLLISFATVLIFNSGPSNNPPDIPIEYQTGEFDELYLQSEFPEVSGSGA